MFLTESRAGAAFILTVAPRRERTNYGVGGVATRRVWGNPLLLFEHQEGKDGWGKKADTLERACTDTVRNKVRIIETICSVS